MLAFCVFLGDATLPRPRPDVRHIRLLSAITSILELWIRCSEDLVYDSKLTSNAPLREVRHRGGLAMAILLRLPMHGPAARNGRSDVQNEGLDFCIKGLQCFASIQSTEEHFIDYEGIFHITGIVLPGLRCHVLDDPRFVHLKLLLLAHVVNQRDVARSPHGCPASERVLVETHNVTHRTHEFQVSSKACSADVLASTPNSRSVQKRQYNSCASGETLTYRCITGQGQGPVYADCVALANAIAATYGTNYQELFIVNPQFVQEFSLGTCLYAWINENPVGGAYLEYCYTGVAEVLGPNIDSSCIENGDTGGYVLPSNPNLVPASVDWAFEVLLN